MKISFTAKFHSKERFDSSLELKLNDVFLLFLPRKLAITESKRAETYSSASYYDVSMETQEFFTIERMEEILNTAGIIMRGIGNIKREFTKKELEKVKTSIAYKKIFEKPKKGTVLEKVI